MHVYRIYVYMLTPVHGDGQVIWSHELSLAITV